MQFAVRTLRVLIMFVGILLLFTGAGKAWLIFSDPFADLKLGVSLPVLIAFVAFEIWLGSENLFQSIDLVRLGRVNFLLFCAFTCFSGYRWLLGYTTCMCAGVSALPIGVFFALDCFFVGMFGWLCFFSKISRSLPLWTGFFWTVNTKEIGRLTGVTVSCAILYLLNGPFFDSGRAGDSPVRVMTDNADFRLGRVTELEGWLYNGSTSPVKVVGFSKSCNCLKLSELEGLVVEARSKHKFTVAVRPEKIGPLRQKALLYLDHPEQFRVTIDVVGNVKE